MAAVGVLIYHFAYLDSLLSIPVLGRFLHYGPSLLGYFFVLTGFVLVISMAQNGVMPATLSARTFWINRLARIYPLHLLALALMIGLQLVLAALHLLPAQASVSRMEPGPLVAQVLLVHAWYPSPAFAFVYNPVSWTLSVELLLMLLAPLLYRWMVNQSTPRLLRTVVLIWVVSLLVHYVCMQAGVARRWVYFWPPVHVPEFMMGMMGGFIMVRHRTVLEQRVGRMRWINLGSAALMIGLIVSSAPILNTNSLIFAPTYLLFIVNFCLQRGWVTRLCSARPLQHLGRLSYGIYILQLPVSIGVLRLLPGLVDWPYKVLLLLFLLVLTGVSALVYRYVERPAQAYVRTVLGKRTVQPQPVVA